MSDSEMKSFNSFYWKSLMYINVPVSSYVFWIFYKKKKYSFKKSVIFTVIPNIIAEIVFFKIKTVV